MASITSANAVFYLTIGGLYPPTKLQEWAVDDAFTAEPIAMAETAMTIDGTLAAGFINAESPMTIAFVASSPSCLIFDTWAAASKALQDIYPAIGVITIPGLGMSYALTRGILKTFPPIAPAKKVMGQRQFGVTGERIVAAPI